MRKCILCVWQIAKEENGQCEAETVHVTSNPVDKKEITAGAADNASWYERAGIPPVLGEHLVKDLFRRAGSTGSNMQMSKTQVTFGISGSQSRHGSASAPSRINTKVSNTVCVCDNDVLIHKGRGNRLSDRSRRRHDR